MSVCCFYLERTDQIQRGLRRYIRRYKGKGYTCEEGWHDALVLMDVVSEKSRAKTVSGDDQWRHDDKRWPRTCDRCDYEFTDDDHWQLFCNHLYRRTDTGELLTLRDAPPGAMWDSDWLPERWWRGPDGRALTVKLPNGRDWIIDSRANNCTMPDDDVHRCWVRHGEPPRVTVDKNGNTCQAGGGSIQSGDYHGFLRDGCFDP